MSRRYTLQKNKHVQQKGKEEAPLGKGKKDEFEYYKYGKGKEETPLRIPSSSFPRRDLQAITKPGLFINGLWTNYERPMATPHKE